MFLRAYRRSQQRRLLRAGILLVVVAFFLDLISLLNRYHDFQFNLYSNKIPDLSLLPAALSHQKIFIAATHWNNAAILSSHWNAALLDLVKTLGPENVFVSIVESGSWDDSKNELRKLDHELGVLGVSRKVVLDETTHADEMAKGPPILRGEEGWIHTPRSGDKKEIRRIPYLSRLRNRSLIPLRSMNDPSHQGEHNRVFDKVLFLNDVVFTTADVLTLLATRRGEYAAACSLDFKNPPTYYDTFALRDSDGDPTISMSYPYFRSSQSRHGMMQGKATRLQSCWNGMVFMEAGAFYSSSSRQGALGFRGIDDSLAEEHLEGSECCLIHADTALLGAGEHGVWMNPSVRVGYSGEAYNQIHAVGDGGFVTSAEYVWGAWMNRFMRWFSTERFKRRFVQKRLSKWMSEAEPDKPRSEPGEMCLINEMQVLIENGWKHL